MKQLFLSLALMAVSLCACSQNKSKEETKMNNNKTERRTLVAYFSASGVTKAAAQQLAEAANADIYEITPEKTYTDADLNWHDDNSRSSVEMRNSKSRPAIKGQVDHIEQYDTVYIGFPIWWYTAPTIINTFVEQHNLKGKTLVTFATSGGSTVTKATNDLKKAYPELTWKEGTLLNRGTKDEAMMLVEKIRE